MGALFVISMTTLAYRLGIATFSLITVLFQLASAIVLDHWGLVGLPKREATSGRVVGLVVGVVGLCVMNFEVRVRNWVMRRRGASRNEADEEGVEKRGEEGGVINTSHGGIKITHDAIEGVVSDSAIVAEKKSNDATITTSTPQRTSNIFDPSILIVALVGISMALQAGMNSTLGTSYNSPSFGTFFALSTAIPFMFIYFLLFDNSHFTSSFKPQNLQKTFQEAPWWSWTSGILGFGFVASITFLSGYLGVAPFLGTAVSFQVVSAVIVDHFGWLGLPERRPLTLSKCVGATLVVVGAVMMTVL
jgi:transporter family-2 protein